MNALIIPSGFVKGQNVILKSIVKQLNNYVDDFVVIDLYKTNKLKNLLKEENIKYINFGEIDVNITFQEQIKIYDNFFEKNKIDTLFVFRMPINEAIKHKRNGARKYIDRITNNELSNLVFTMNSLAIRQLLLIRQASNYCKKIIHIVFDPQEIRLHEFIDNNQNLIEAYFLKRKGMKYVPTFEKYLFEELSKYSVDKNIELSFYCTALSKDRTFISDKKEELENYKDNWDVRIINTAKQMISQNEYYDKLINSKYTLIIKSYDVRTFSFIRFLESLSCNCLPLIVDDVCLDELQFTYPNVYNIIIKRGLVTKLDAKEIENKCIKLNKQREMIIEELLESIKEKGIFDDNKLRKFYKRLTNV